MRRANPGERPRHIAAVRVEPQGGSMPADEQTKVRLDQFTSRVVPDPKNPGEALLITGFLGPSSEPEHTRIYFDATLSRYVDAPTNEILHTEPLPKEQSPLGGSYIWLKRDTEVLFGKAGADRAKAKFFEGPVMAAYGGQFGGAAGQAAGGFEAAAGWGGFGGYGGGGGFGGGGGGGAIFSAPVICQPSPFCPPSVYHICPTQVCTHAIFCPSFVFVCHTAVCQFQSAVCQVSPGCPPPPPGTPVQFPGAMGAMGMAAQAAGAGAGGAGPAYTAQVICHPVPYTAQIACHPTPLCPTAVCSHHIYCFTPACPVLTAFCLVHTPFCPVLTATCPITPACPVQTPACPIQTLACPIQTAGCPGPGPGPGPGPVFGGGAQMAGGGAQGAQPQYPVWPTVYCRTFFLPCISQHHPCTPGCPM